MYRALSQTSHEIEIKREHLRKEENHQPSLAANYCTETRNICYAVQLLKACKILPKMSYRLKQGQSSVANGQYFFCVFNIKGA